VAGNREKDFDFSDIIVDANEPTDAPIISDELDFDQLGKDIAEIEKYKGRDLEAFTQAAASTATFSLSDRAQKALGIRTEEDLRKLREYNPEADIAGTVTGAVGPLITSGPVGAIGIGARTAAKAGQAVESAILKATAPEALKSTAKEVLRKSAAKGMGSAVEGAAFGVGALLREDALGEAEVNAENLLSFAGSGALLGGAIGASLPVAGSAASVGARKISKAAKDTFGTFAKKVADPAEDAMELLGYTPKMKSRALLDEVEKSTVADLPRWLREDVGWTITDKESDRLFKLMRLGETSGKQIDTILTNADEKIAQKFGPQQLQNARVQLFRRVAQDLRTEALDRLGSMPSANPARRRLDRLVSNIETYAERISRPNQLGSANSIKFAKEIRQLRNEIWDTYKSLPMEEKGTQVGSILRNSYGKMAKSLENFVEAADEGLAEQLRKANQNYSRFKKYEEPLARRAVKDKSLLTFKDLIFGGVGYGAGGIPGALVAGARKLLDSDIKRMVTVLSSVEKSNKEAAKAIKQGVGGFFKAQKMPGVKAGSINALLATDLSNERKNRKAAFKEVSQNLKTLINEPEMLERRVARATSVLSIAAPQTAQVAATRMVAGLQFLASKVPRPVSDVRALGKKQEYEPSSMEMAKFERYLQAVERPLSVMKDLEQGTLTREHVEALAAVYPRMLQSIREQVLQELDAGAQVPYNRRVQLGILLDLPSDPSLQAETVLALQANYRPEEAPQQAAQGAVKQTVGGLQAVKISDRIRTESQRIAEKGE
jgi:uncharacterized coiled-coil DUF342 family protein